MPTQVVPTNSGTVETGSLMPETSVNTQQDLTGVLEGFQTALYGEDSGVEQRVPTVEKLLGQKQFALPSEFAGKTLKDFTTKYGGNFDILGQMLGVNPNEKLSADQVFTLQNVEGIDFGGSSEGQLISKYFSKSIQTEGTVKPQEINRLEGFAYLQESFGINELQNGLNYLKAEQRELEALLRQNVATEKGKPVPMGVIAGRVTEQQRTARENLEFNQRQQNFIIDQLNSANQTVSMFMQYAGLDYQDAVKRYDTEFAQNLAIAKFTHAVETDKRDFEFQVEQYETQQAQAALTTYANAITAGNLNVGDLSADQKLQIRNLETKSGLAPGTIENLQLAPSDKILTFSGDKTQALVMGEDGNMQVVNTGLRKSTGTGTASEREINALIDEANRKLSEQEKDFSDLVEAYANSLELDEIYTLYSKTEAGKAYGTPTENPQAIAIRYREITGNLTDDDRAILESIGKEEN